jgi:hypothetical protein
MTWIFLFSWWIATTTITDVRAVCLKMLFDGSFKTEDLTLMTPIRIRFFSIFLFTSSDELNVEDVVVSERDREDTLDINRIVAHQTILLFEFQLMDLYVCFSFLSFFLSFFLSLSLSPLSLVCLK